MKGKILVTGSDGLVGSRFVEISRLKKFLLTPKQSEVDITNPSQIKQIVNAHKIVAVIHFAAFTNVSKAEEERNDKNGVCWKVNVQGTKNLVDTFCSRLDKIHFIQISTDMIFSGSEEDPGPYYEEHIPEKRLDKLTWYGFSKAEAERIVTSALGKETTILRLIYPVRAKFDKKLDYLRKPLNMYDQGNLYPLFTDQQISITFIDEACMALDKIILGKKRGIFHASSSDTTTPYQIISYLLQKVHGAKNVVKPASLEEFMKTKGFHPYRYPKFGGLKVEKTEKILGIKFSTCKEIVDKLLDQGIG